MVDLSIIVPIYNGENYIAQCLSCIPAKTMMTLEIILVDDCSQDKTPELLEKAAAGDSRIRTINFDENKGISAARNAALDEAVGRYVYFADVDDTFDFSGLETLYNMAVCDDLDVAIGYRREFAAASQTYLPYRIKTKDSGVVPGDRFFLLSVNDRFQGIGPWQNLYNKGFLMSNNLKYMEGILHEDNEFFPHVHKKAQKVRFIDLPFYTHRLIAGSVSNASNFRKDSLDRIKILESHIALSNSSNSSDFETALSGLMGYNITRWAESYARITDPEIRKEILEKMDRWKIFKSCLKSPRFRYRIRAFLLLVYPDALKLFIHPSKRNH